jgi:hypothetical protein
VTGGGSSPGRPWRGGRPLLKPARARPWRGGLNRQQGEGARLAPGRARGHQSGAEPKVLAGVRDRGGTTVTTGPTAVRPAGRTRGTAGTPREDGEDFKGPWGA